MARPAKDGIPFNIKMQRELFEKLTEFCIQTGRSKTGTVEVALLQYIETEEKKMGVDGNKGIITT